MAEQAANRSFAAADIGLSFAGAWASWSATREANKTAEANAAASNRIRTANNSVAAANASLAAWLQARNNRALLAAGGREYNAAATNLQRGVKARQQVDFDAALAAAEEDGALAARSAASGVGGTAMTMLSASSRLATARVQLLRERQGNQITQDEAAVLAGIMPSAVSRQGFNTINAGQDYSLTQAQTTQNSLVSQLLAGALDSRSSIRTLLGTYVPEGDKVSPPTVNVTSRAAVAATSYPVSSGEAYITRTE